MKRCSSFWIVALVFCFWTSITHAAVLAKVNGTNITEEDLTSALSGFNEGQKRNILEDENSRKQIIQSLVDQELLVQEAEKSKLENSKEYQQALKSFRKQFLSSLIIQKKLGSQMTEKAAQKYYQSNRSQFSTTQVHAQHILLDSEKEARQVLSQARKPGADFQTLAEKNSKDPSAKRNRGDLGFFTRDRMVPEFSRAAFEAKVGSIIGPVKTSFGYHVIKVLERKPGKALEYGEVELRVKGQLKQDLVRKYVTRLRQSAKINIK